MQQADPAPHRNATVSLTAITPFVRLFEEMSPDLVIRTVEHTQRALAQWGIELDQLDDPTARLPHALVAQLLLDFIEITEDASVPLRAAMKLQHGDYELLEYLCGTTASLGESIACLGRYYPLLIAAEKELHVLGDRAEARFRIAPGLEAPEAMHEFGVASNLAMTTLHLSLENAQLPIEICFAHDPPAHAGALTQVFPCPVRFGCEHNAIVFPAAMLAHPMRSADPQLHAVLTRLADIELAALSDQSAFPAKVREAIEAELPRGAALEAVAERLHLSPSAVRSRLRQHGTSYSAMLDRLRRDLAKRALRQSHLSFAEVAHQLGFAHPPAFHRAFRRWFGVTPSAYRQAPSTSPTSRFLQRKR
jgi:AraC-like DNA-binding protein